MRARSDSPAITHDSIAYDPFGEPVALACEEASAAGDRRARRIAVIGFWLVVALLTAGRISLADAPVAQMVAQAQAQVAALLTAIL